MLVAGMIASTSPARGPEFAPSTSDLPNSLSQEVDDLLVSFSAQPNQPGENLITVRAVSTRCPALVAIIRVILRFTFKLLLFFMGSLLPRNSPLDKVRIIV